MPLETVFGAWVATGLTLFIFTFLYKDNPLFKLAEHLYVGVSVGYIIVKTWDTVVIHFIYEPITKNGEWSLLIPVCIGMLMLTRYVPKISWMSRLAFAFIVGVGSGLAIPRVISSYILKQVEDTVRPLVSIMGGNPAITWDLANPASSLNSLILLMGVVSVLFYFFFSIEHTGAVKVAARTGIVFLMIAFGAAFGYTVMARMSLLIGRMSDLIDYSASTYLWATPVLLIITIVLLVAFGRRGDETPPEAPRI